MKNPTDSKDAWREALNYLLRYERPESYRTQRVVRAKSCIQELISKGVVGELSGERFEEIRDALDLQEHRIARDAFVTNVHSTVLTTDWFDQLAEVLKGHTVLEVGAGRGCMIQPMNRRGVTWIGVQTNPDNDCFIRPVPVQNYVSAIRGYRKKVDFIYMAWPALRMGDQETLEVVRAAQSLNVPLLLVSERRVDTSCCNDLWDRQYHEGYRVVKTKYAPAQWRGIRDALWLVMDERSLQGTPKKGEGFIDPGAGG